MFTYISGAEMEREPTYPPTPPQSSLKHFALTDTMKKYVYIDDFFCSPSAKLHKETKQNLIQPYTNFTPTYNLPLFVCLNALSLNL